MSKRKKNAVDNRETFKYIFGPVSSWRLGVSLGIDPVSQSRKTCSMDCVYCQLGQTVHFSDQRRIFVPTQKIIEELRRLPRISLDTITFSSNGEPTLALNLGELIKEVKATRKEKVAVITNSSLMGDPFVQEDLLKADCVVAKLDACSEDAFCQINQVMKSLQFSRVVSGIKKFRKRFKGKLALQIMFIDANKENGKGMAALAWDIRADEIELNTPLRPSAVQPLDEKTLIKIKKEFKGLPAITVYEVKKKEAFPFSISNTIKRHGSL